MSETPMSAPGTPDPAGSGAAEAYHVVLLVEQDDVVGLRRSGPGRIG